MTTITITADESDSSGSAFRATGGARESVGRTAGAALDALTEQLDDAETGTLVVVQNFRGDAFFTTADQKRLSELLARWRNARRSGVPMSAEDQEALRVLVDRELDAAAKRSAAMASELRP